MTDAALASSARSRSLGALALARLARDRVALAAAATLLAITALCAIGPLVTPHAHDRVYRSYVLLPPSLEAYPREGDLEAAMRSALSRGRAELTAFETEGDRFRAEIAAPAAIDPRVLRSVDRTDAFERSAITATGADGRTATVEGAVTRHRFLLGTDANGRDLLARVLVGGQVSLAVGALATMVSLVIGVAWGAIAGYAGGAVDGVMMRIVDALYALPFVFLAILLVVTFGGHVALMFLLIGAIEWLDMARIVRGQTLSLRRREFVVAARALGVPPLTILRRHVVPNLAGPIIVVATLTAPKVMLLESFLSFLGLGVQEPLTSWGALIARGVDSLQGAPHLLLAPAAFFVATVAALNMLGDRLRDALDPKMR